MRSLETIRLMRAHHPAVRPFSEISAWGWVAAAILSVLLLAAWLMPDKHAAVNFGMLELIEPATTIPTEDAI